MSSAQPSKWDWQAAVLLVSLLMTISVRLELTRWAKQLGYVESITLMGALLGLALGVTYFGSWIRRGLVAGYTLFYIPLALANMIEEEVGGLARMQSLMGRLLVSIEHIVASQPVSDPLLFVSVMAILMWFMAIYCTNILIRTRDITKTLLLPTLIILTIQFFDGQVSTRLWNLAVYFFLCLALIGRLNLLRAHDAWASEGVIAGTQPESDLNRYMLIFSAAVIMVAWLLPYPQEYKAIYLQSVKKAGETTSYFEQRFQDLFAALTPSVIISRIDPYPNSFVLGSHAATGPQKIMQVQLTDGVDPIYWPVKVYDHLYKGKWLAQTGSQELVNPGQTTAPNGAEVGIHWLADGTNTLVLPHNGAWVSRVATIEYDRDLGPEYPLFWTSQIIVQTGDEYTSLFSQKTITQKDLRNAGNSYPEYLSAQLSDQQNTLSEDVNALALEIVGDQKNPFDKAVLITRFLRTNYTYSESIDEIPKNVDPLDHFLFNNKKGFCNQFATAEVALLRANGIPARLVLGYVDGENLGGRRIEFQQKNSHTWPEAYFPGVGWVIFEPTPSITDVSYPSGEMISSSSSPAIPLGDFANRERNKGIDQEQFDNGGDSTTQAINLSWQTVVWIFTGILVGMVFITKRTKISAAIGAFPEMAMARIERSGIGVPSWIFSFLTWLASKPAAKSFILINVGLYLLGTENKPSQTPKVKCEILAQQVPDAAKEISALAMIHEKALFGDVNELVPLKIQYLIFSKTAARLWKRWLYGS